MIQISPENLVPESAIHQDHPSGPTFSKRTNTCQSQNNKRQNSTFHYHCPCKILTLNRHQNPKEFKKESERKQAELMPPQANPTSHSLRITSFVISNTWFPLLPSWYLQHHSFTLYKPGNPKKTLFTYSPSPRLLLTAKFINPITNKNMLDIWSWICGLPYSTERAESESSLFFALGNSYQDDSSRSIQLRAEMTSGSDSEQVVIFKVYSQGFELDNPPKTLWVSDACPLSSDKPFLPLFLQLLEEIITRSPSAQDSTCPRSLVQKLKPNPIAWIMDSHSPESFSSFFDLVFLTRLFWLCVFDAPSGVGSLYFNAILGPNIEALTYKHAPVLRTFLQLVGVDVELCFMRSLGYIFAKWLILREMGVGLQTLTPLPNQHPGFSYATEAHGFWILKGYALISAMKQTRSDGNRSFKFPVMDAKESVLRYALAHQHLEAVLQLEYSVEFRDGYIQVNAHVDNLRFHVAKLGFNKNEDLEYADERHFPTRIRVWVGPEVGSTYVSGLSLGRSTKNGEREIETQRNLKGTYGYSKIPKVKARARTTIKTKTKNWRWDQDAEGNAGVFDAVLCDNTTGQELATWNGGSSNSSFRNRYMGGNRPFTKTGGLVFARDEYGEGVGWRLSREMEGSVLKWRIGGQVWLSYWPNKVKSSYRETRLVEWCDEVDLPLIPGK